MVSRILSGGAIATIAGAAMLAASSNPSPAFTLESPSLEPPVAAAGVEPIYWHHWGWHHWGWHHWGWHHPWHRWWGPRWGWYGYYGPGPVVVRRCWISRWGYRHCVWW